MKLDVYKRIAAISNDEEYSDMIDELTDRFSEIPKSALNLLKIASIKANAHNALISSITQESNKIKIVVRKNEKISSEKILKMIESYNGKLKFSGKEGYMLVYSLENAKPKISYDSHAVVRRTVLSNKKKTDEKEIFDILDKLVADILDCMQV